jgi:hypothetical protein
VHKLLGASLLAITLLSNTQAAQAFLESDFVQRYCPNMPHEYRMPDNTRTDCISDTHAIEVEKSQYWHQAIGQSLHYALWTRQIAESPQAFSEWSAVLSKPRKAGIVLVCVLPRETCTDHYVRLFRIVEEYKLPITIWDCDLTDMTLATCQEIDMPRQITLPSE